MENILDILRSEPLFEGMDEQVLQKIASKATIKHFAAGETLIHQGEEQIDLFIIRSGSVEVTISEPSPEEDLPQSHRISTLTAGQTVGNLSFIDQQPRSASVTALEPSTIFVLPGAEFRKKANKEVYMAISKNLAESLRKTNEVTVHSLKGELKKTKQNANAGLFMTYLLLIFAGYSFTTNLLRKLVNDPSTELFASSPFILIVSVLFFLMIRRFHYPYENFGLTLRNSRRAIYEAIIVTIPFCLIVTLVKWLLISYTSAYSDLPLFDWPSSDPSGKITVSFMIIGMLVYGFFVPFQEFIARGVLQSSLQDLFIHGSPWKANIIASALFATMHLHISQHLAFVMFFPSLLWGWLYMRNKTLVASTLSHLLIGWYSLFALGIDKILITA